MFLFAIVFGLSMDYEVFLVTRMHEEWEHTKDARFAVRHGLALTGKVIMAAAIIMISVFGSVHPRRRPHDQAVRPRAWRPRSSSTRSSSGSSSSRR